MTNQIVIVETGEVVDVMNRVEAETITRKITSHLDGVTSHYLDAATLLTEALTRQAWAALGYEAPVDYVSGEFGDAIKDLPAPIRSQFVVALSSTGASTRAIAPVVGVSDMTVRRDQVRHHVAPATEPAAAQVPTEWTPAPEPPGANRVSTSSTPEPITDPAPAPEPAWSSASDTLAAMQQAAEQADPGHIIGRDGKTYPRPVPAKQKRKPLTDRALRTAEDMTRAAEHLEDIFRDDRMPKNREQVAALTRSHLNRTIQVCNDLLNQLDA